MHLCSARNVLLLNSAMSAIPPRKSVRKIRFEDSSTIEERIVNDILMKVVVNYGCDAPKACTAPVDDVRNSSVFAEAWVDKILMKAITKSDCNRSRVTKSHEKENSLDLSCVDSLKPTKGSIGILLIALMVSIAKRKGFIYGINYFRYVQLRKKNGTHLVTGCFRCPRYDRKADLCPCNIIVSLQNLNSNRAVSVNLNHSYKPGHITDDDIKRRHDTLGNTI